MGSVSENDTLVQIWSQKAAQQLMLAQNRDSSQQPNDSVAYDPYWSFHSAWDINVPANYCIKP